MRFVTSGQIASLITLICLIASPSWMFASAFIMSVLLIALETYLVAHGPQTPSAELQKQVQELKDQIGNIQLAMSFRRD